MKRVWLFQILWFFMPLTASAGEVLYARSSGDLQARSHPGRYSALNILDDDKSTVWCSAGTGKGAEIEVVFSERVHIEKMAVATGNQTSSKTYKSFNRMRQMAVSVGDMVHTVELEDKEGSQTLNFDPTLTTDRLVLRLKAGFRGSGKRHTCISDIVFYRGSRPLNGKHLKNHVKKSRKTVEFLDTWVSGPEYARDRELIFGVSGTYRYLYVPNDAQDTPLRKTGRWRMEGKNPAIKVGDKWTAIKVKRDDAGRVIKLKVEEGQMAGVYMRRKQE
ncbi:hypothetical protein ACFL2F_05205 [Myxococcota bacterium]